MEKLVKISKRINCGRYGRVVEKRAEGYTEIDVGRKTGRLPALENENHIILVDSLHEEIDAIEIIGTVNTAINDLIVDAQRAARWMNDNYEQRDLNRKRVNYGVMTQALRTLRALGYDPKNATWGDGDFLICEKITINGREVFKRQGGDDMKEPIKFKEYRTMDASTLRRVCIENNWYTCGTNEEYGNLFDRLRDGCGYAENLTTEKMVEIAADIWEHSEMPRDYTLETVLFELARNCYTTFNVDE